VYFHYCHVSPLSFLTILWSRYLLQWPKCDLLQSRLHSLSHLWPTQQSNLLCRAVGHTILCKHVDADSSAVGQSWKVGLS
jgi:hypothetical protein